MGVEADKCGISNRAKGFAAPSVKWRRGGSPAPTRLKWPLIKNDHSPPFVPAQHDPHIPYHTVPAKHTEQSSGTSGLVRTRDLTVIVTTIIKIIIIIIV